MHSKDSLQTAQNQFTQPSVTMMRSGSEADAVWPPVLAQDLHLSAINYVMNLKIYNG